MMSSMILKDAHALQLHMAHRRSKTTSEVADARQIKYPALNSALNELPPYRILNCSERHLTGEAHTALVPLPSSFPSRLKIMPAHGEQAASISPGLLQLGRAEMSDPQIMHNWGKTVSTFGCLFDLVPFTRALESNFEPDNLFAI